MGIKEWYKQILANLFGTWLAAVGGAMSGTILAYLSSAPSWVYIISIMVGMLIGLLILSFYKKEPVSSGIGKPSPAIDAHPDIEFFPTIDDLRTRHPLHETFNRENEIHAFLLSGEGIFAEHSEYIKYVKRLILPLPDDNNLARLRGISKTIDFKSQIFTYRNMARRNNVESVHFYKDFTGISLLFCNPNRLEAWVQVGMILPESESGERHHYRLYKSKNEKAFLSLYETFNRLWNASNENTEEEDMREGFDRETTLNRPVLQVPIGIEIRIPPSPNGAVEDGLEPRTKHLLYRR